MRQLSNRAREMGTGKVLAGGCATEGGRWKLYKEGFAAFLKVKSQLLSNPTIGPQVKSFLESTHVLWTSIGEILELAKWIAMQCVENWENCLILATMVWIGWSLFGTPSGAAY